RLTSQDTLGILLSCVLFFTSRRRHARFSRDWSSDVCSSDLLDEDRKHIEKDAALERRFQPILVDEPTVAHTIEILKGLRDRYEAHHRVSINDEALVAAATLADRYVSDRFLPDKASDLIDEAGARLQLGRAAGRERR